MQKKAEACRNKNWVDYNNWAVDLPQNLLTTKAEKGIALNYSVFTFWQQRMYTFYFLESEFKMEDKRKVKR